MEAAEPPTVQELDDFIVENRQWITEEAEEVLRGMTGKDQRHVLEEGSMSNCRDPVAIIRTRALHGYLKADQRWVEERKSLSTEELLEDFVQANMKWLNDEAEEVLRGLSPEDQRKVIEVGSLQGCRDPVAIVKSRARQRFPKGKGKGKGKASKGKIDQWDIWNSGGTPALHYAPGGGGGGGGPPKISPVQGDVSHKELVKAENQQAVDEGRSLYVVGIPPMWTAKQLEDFFNHQGRVQWVHLMPVKAGQGTRAAFANFATAEDATTAAQICDQLEIDDRGEKFTLTCSIKQRTGEKTFGKKSSVYTSAQLEHTRARGEGRVVYLSRLPLGTDEPQVQDLVEQFGVVKEVYALPANGITQACFVTMASAEEAGYLTQMLNGAPAFGTTVCADIAKEKGEKRKRPFPEDEGDYHVLELRNFPHWTTVDDLKACIEIVNQKAHRVRVLNHDPQGTSSLARVYFTSQEAMEAARHSLDGFEFTPGFALKASVRGGGGGCVPPPPPSPNGGGCGCGFGGAGGQPSMASLPMLACAPAAGGGGSAAGGAGSAADVDRGPPAWGPVWEQAGRWSAPGKGCCGGGAGPPPWWGAWAAASNPQWGPQGHGFQQWSG